MGVGRNTYRIVLREGRKRQIRRMVELLGRRVVRLQRVAIGSLQLGDLRLGASRPLTVGELDTLWEEAGGRASAHRLGEFEDRAETDMGGD